MEALSTTENDGSSPADVDLAVPTGQKSQKLDKTFFGPGGKNSGHLSMPFNYKYTELGSSTGKQLSRRKARAMIALERGFFPIFVHLMSFIKHFIGFSKGRIDNSVFKQLDDF